MTADLSLFNCDKGNLIGIVRGMNIFEPALHPYMPGAVGALVNLIDMSLSAQSS